MDLPLVYFLFYCLSLVPFTCIWYSHGFSHQSAEGSYEMAFLGWPTGDCWQFNHVSRFLCFVNDTCGSYHMQIMFSFHMKQVGWVEFSVDTKYVWAIELKEVGERKLSWKLWVDHCCWSVTVQWFWRKQNKQSLMLFYSQRTGFHSGIRTNWDGGKWPWMTYNTRNSWVSVFILGILYVLLVWRLSSAGDAIAVMCRTCTHDSRPSVK